MATINSTECETLEEKRKTVMLGDLPPDFLCLPQSLPAQILSDEQLAASLQYQQTNGPPGFCAPVSSLPRLSITLVQAKLSKNYGITRMDPYCRVRVGHSVFESQSDFRGGRNPRWNKTVFCYLPSGIDNIYLEIFNEGTFTMDKLVAWSHIKITEKVLQGDASDDWYILNGQQGEGKEGMINLILSISESPMPLPTNHTNVIYTVPPMPLYQHYVNPPMNVAVIPNHPNPAQQQNQQGMPSMNYVQPNNPPPQIQQGPLFNDDDVEQAKEMFPNIEEEVIKSVFECNRGNKDATINGLLQMSQ